MKYRDLDAGELFFFEDNFDYPKLKTENGHKDLRDNVTGSAPDDLSIISVYALQSERDRLAEALRKLILSLNDHHTVHDLNIDVLYAIRDGNSLLDKDKS